MDDEIKRLRGMYIKDANGFAMLGVGDRLQKIIHDAFDHKLVAMLFPRDVPDCNCNELAGLMNELGVDGCRRYRTKIIRRLTENGIKASVMGLGWLVVGEIEAKAGEWVDKAISDVDHNMKILKQIQSIAKERSDHAS